MRVLRTRVEWSLVVLVALMLGCVSARAVTGARKKRIDIYKGNPAYWQYDDKPVLLLGGSDDDNLFQWTGSKLTKHLDLLKSVGGNYVRNTMSDRDRVEHGQVPGLNVDNVFAFAKAGDRYDLDQWNEEYWDRLRNFMEETVKRDIIVQLTFWDIHDMRGKVYIAGQTGSWESHPWNPKNNINYTSAETGLAEELGEDRDLIKQAKHPFFATVPGLDNAEKVLRYQEKYVRKILSICLPYGHVLYNVENEALTPLEWMDYWAKFARTEAKAAGLPIYITGMRRDRTLRSGEHTHVIDHPELYDYLDISQNSSNMGQVYYDNIMFRRSEIEKKGARPINNVKIYSWPRDSEFETAHRFLRNVFAGCASSRFHRRILRDGSVYSGIGLSDVAQTQIRSTRMLTDAMNIFAMLPRNDLLSEREENEAYALAEVGKQYAIYFPDGGEVKIDLSAASGKLHARWFNIGKSRWANEQKLRGGKVATLNAPSSGQWAVLIKR